MNAYIAHQEEGLVEYLQFWLDFGLFRDLPVLI